MGYDSQVRRLYGKVKIIYQDADASYEIGVNTSGDSKISSPNQVYEGNLLPTAKACTMDGHSTMNGEYQMIDETCIVGWWSDELSDENGEYQSGNYPFLELNFIKRPVSRWTLLGDRKLEQFLVDFDLELYDENNDLLLTHSVRDNEEMKLKVVFERLFDNVARIKLIVRKINTPNAVVKLIQFFDVLEENYSGGDLKEFEVLEALATDGEGISYGITSNTLNVTIYNKDRKFDLGHLKDYLLLDRTVIPYIGIENEQGEIEYQQLGVYYSDEWSVPQEGQWVKLKCLDRLMKFQKMTYIGYPFSENVSLKAIAEDILKSAGLSQNKYEIDEKLGEMIVPYAFLGKKSVWDALQDVCNAGLCRVYLTRDNVVKISVENLEVENNGMEIKPNRIFSYEMQTRKTDFSNHIEVNYSDINASLTESTRQIVYSNMITIDPNSKRRMIVDYSQNVTNAYLTYLPIENINLLSFKSSINCGEFELENTSDQTIVVTVEISGLAIAVNTQTVIIEDEKSVGNYGVMSYKPASSELVQTYSRAVEIGNYFMQILNQGAGTLRIVWRGDPDLKLENKFTCVNRFGVAKEYINQYNRFTFDGGLKQETKAREV